jgi:polysaccharide lyase family 4-like protein/copper binding plastocyanin/azurin family protein
MRLPLSAARCGLLAIAGTVGCSTPAAEPVSSAFSIPADELPLATASARPATVVGTAPALKGGLPTVIVLQPQVRLRYPPQATLPLMDQVAHQFTPPVLVVRTGQPADFRNDDDTMHNVRVLQRDHDAQEAVFNVVLPQGGSYKHVFRRDGAYDVRCDMHQSMRAVVVSTSSPYATVADAEGAFSLEGVSPGAYTLVAYSGEAAVERKLDLAEHQRVQVDLR